MARHAPGHVAGHVVVGAGGTVDMGGGGNSVVVVGAMVVEVVVVVVVAVVVVVVVGDGRVVVVLGRVVVVAAGAVGGGPSGPGLVVGGAVFRGIVPLIQPSRSVVGVVGGGGRVEATGMVRKSSVAIVVGVSTAPPTSDSVVACVVGERSVRSYTLPAMARVSDLIGRSARLSGAAVGASVVLTAMARVVTVALAVAAAAASGVEPACRRRR